MGRAVTLGSLHREGKLLDIGCGTCSTISYIPANSLGLMMNVEIQEIARFRRCQECGAYNTSNNRPIWVKPDARLTESAVAVHSLPERRRG